MSRKQLCLILVTALIAAMSLANPEVYAEYPQNGYQWSNTGGSTKRLVCIDILKKRVGARAWADNNRRAAATLYCIERFDDYYEEHPKDHSLEQAKEENMEDILWFFTSGQS